MNPIEYIRINRAMLRVYNSGQYSEFENLMNKLMSHMNYAKFFKSKRYVWGLIRPDDFYRNMADYIIHTISSSSDYWDTMAPNLISLVLTTTENIKAKRSFIWRITKKIPLLTANTVPFMSPERIRNILESDKAIITDNIIGPFIDEVKKLKDELIAYQIIAET